MTTKKKKSDVLPLGLRTISSYLDKAAKNPPPDNVWDLAIAALAHVYQLSSELRTKMDTRLADCTMKIVDTSSEEELMRLIQKYWPDSLDGNATRVPYALYRELDKVSESGARYLQERYELAHGDVDGTFFLDVRDYAEITAKESWSAYMWLKDAERTLPFVKRVAQVFSEWADTALRMLNEVKKEALTTSYSVREVLGAEGQPITAQLAKGGQMVCRFRLRECSASIRSELERMKSYLGVSEWRFYEDHLSQTGQQDKITPSGVNADTASRALIAKNAYMSMVQSNQNLLDDVARRHQVYFTCSRKIVDRLSERAVYRAMHERMAKRGVDKSAVKSSVTIDRAPSVPEEKLPTFSLGDSYIQPPAEAMKEALKGSWGVPSKYNPYVTSNDPRITQGAVGGLSAHAYTHFTGGSDLVYFSSLEHSTSDDTLHDNYDSLPHISATSKSQWDSSYSHSIDTDIHLSAEQKTGLTGGGVTDLHSHSGGGGGDPGGSDTHVQFNDSGSFGGDSALTWNKTSDTLTLNGVLAHIGSQAGFFSATPVGQNTGWSASNYTPTKSLDPTNATVLNLTEAVCTIIDTLKSYGLFGE